MSYSPDHKYGAKWIFSNSWRQETVHKVDIVWFLIFHPLLEIVANEDDIVRNPAKFAQVSLITRLAEILLAGQFDCLLIVDETKMKRLVFAIKHVVLR